MINSLKQRLLGLSKWQRILFALFLLVAVQLAVPANYAPLRTKLNGKPLGLASIQELKDQVVSSSERLNVVIGKKSIVVPANELGVSTDVNKTLDQVPQLSLAERLVPLGVVAHFVQSPDVSLVQSVNQSQLDKSAADLAKKYSSAPQSAQAIITNGKLEIKDAVAGQQVSSDNIKNAVKTSVAQKNTQVVIKAKEIQPEVTKNDLMAAKTTFEGLSNQTLKLQYGDTTKSYSAAQVRQWLTVQQDANTKKWQLVVSKDALAKELGAWAKEYNLPAGTTQVTTMDGVETSRRNGAAGRAIDGDAVLAQLTTWVNKPSAETVALTVKTLPAKVVVSRFYSASSAGLQAKLDAWVAGHSGSYQVAIVELNGQGRQASYNVSQQTVMASTYKLFVAYAIYKQSETGAINLASTVSTSNSANGLTLEKCIEKAIIYSDNDCAIALGKYVGWAKADEIVAAAGFQNVKLNNYDSSGNLKGDKMVNANELAKFLNQLSAGSLMNGDNTGKLLSYMKRQVYREGIPAGSHGSTVADKVGFLEGYLHDAAIVYGPSSTYALVIMSSGSSWKNISDLADAVYTFMN